MRTIGKLLLMIALSAWATPSLAQHAGGHSHMQGYDMQHGALADSAGCMMQDGMMNMHMAMTKMGMRDQLARSSMLMHTLPSMQSLLDLSDDQVGRLTQIAGTERTSESKLVGQIRQGDQRVEDLLDSGKADADQLKSLLTQVATVKADLAVLRWESVNSMKRELSESQIQRLEEITPSEMCRYMGSTTTMNGMMDMMNSGVMLDMYGGMSHRAMMSGHHAGG